MIAEVIRWRNGTVLVFDERGEPIPEYQGLYSDKREAILRDAPESAQFYEGDWSVGLMRGVNRASL